MTEELTPAERERIAVRRGERDGVFPVSASRMKLYERCPRWYALEHGGRVGGVILVERLPRVQGPAAELGDRFHRLAEAVRLGADVDAAADQLGVPMESWDRWVELRERARRLAAEDDTDLLGIECTISWRSPLPDGREVEYEAKIDELRMRSPGRLKVRDYKTGNQFGLPRDRAALKHDLQLNLYGVAALRDNPGSWEVEVELLLPESDERRRVTLGLRDIERFEAWLETAVTTMANDTEFEPKPGSHCSFCPYALAHCPKGQQLNGRYGALTTDEEAAARVALLVYIEGLAKQLRDQLKDWTAVAGPVAAAGGRWGEHTTSSLTIPPELVGNAVRVLRQYGFDEDSEDFPVRWDGRSGWKLLQGDSAIPELEEMAERRTRRWTGLKREDSRRKAGRRISSRGRGYV